MGDLQLVTDQLVEKHSLNCSDDLVTFATGKNVVVTIEADSEPRLRDSSRVQSTMLSDYKWDGQLRLTSDRLLSVAGNFFSYRLSPNGSVEAVRVFERVTRQRSIIKGFRDAIVDLAWSRTTNMLAVLDASSNLYVYHVTPTCQIEKHVNLRWEDEDGCELLKGATLANLDAQEEEKENPSSRNSSTVGGPAYSRPRLFWCPFVPEDPTEAPSEHLNLLAITRGRSVHVVNVSLLHEKMPAKAEYIDLAKAREIEGAVMTEQLEHPITCLSMSPDATAMAVGDTSGQVSFYVIEETAVKFAHTWRPAAMSSPVKDLFFLDNADNIGEAFWRFCLAVDEEGRQLYLYECENWTCIGRLRVESSMKNGRFMVQVDPTARYVLLTDIDGANLFCIALDYHPSGAPSFAAITQIGFYHPIMAACAFAVQDVVPPISDFSFDDDGGDDDVKPETMISLISITPRSVLHVDVTVERPEKRVYPPSEMASPRAPTIGSSTGGETSAPAESTHTNPVELLPSHIALASGRGSGSRLEGYDTMNLSSSTAVELHSVVKMFEDLSAQMDKLTHHVERADEERRAAATNESIVKMLQQFKEEFSLREDRLLANISDLIETSRAETIAVVRNALNENSLAVENSIQGNHKISTEYVMKAVSERTKEALVQMVIPAIDRVCTTLFKQLNDQFKEGLGQFMTQMRVQQAAMLAASTVASTPLPSGLATDRSALLHLIKTRQVQLAFETVLNQADESALQFVCRQIDPDELFGNVPGGDGGLSQPVLLSLLQQLSYKLDADTDLKFRYIEHLLEALQPYDESIAVHVPKVVSVISDALNEFQMRTPNASLKRQARVITQLVRNLRQ